MTCSNYNPKSAAPSQEASGPPVHRPSSFCTGTFWSLGSPAPRQGQAQGGTCLGTALRQLTLDCSSRQALVDHMTLTSHSATLKLVSLSASCWVCLLHQAVKRWNKIASVKNGLRKYKVLHKYEEDECCSSQSLLRMEPKGSELEGPSPSLQSPPA